MPLEARSVVLINLDRTSKGPHGYGQYAPESCVEDLDCGQSRQRSYPAYYDERVEPIPLSDCCQPKNRWMGESDGVILDISWIRASALDVSALVDVDDSCVCYEFLCGRHNFDWGSLALECFISESGMEFNGFFLSSEILRVAQT